MQTVISIIKILGGGGGEKEKEPNKPLSRIRFYLNYNYLIPRIEIQLKNLTEFLPPPAINI